MQFRGARRRSLDDLTDDNAKSRMSRTFPRNSKCKSVLMDFSGNSIKLKKDMKLTSPKGSPKVGLCINWSIRIINAEVNKHFRVNKTRWTVCTSNIPCDRKFCSALWQASLMYASAKSPFKITKCHHMFAGCAPLLYAYCFALIVGTFLPI